MDIEKNLRLERKKLEMRIDKVSKDIEKLSKTAGKEKLSCNESRGVAQYFINGKYLSKRKYMNKIKAMAQLDYDRKILDKLVEKDYVIQKLMSLGNDESLEKIYEKLCPARKRVVVPAIEPKDDFIEKWKSEEYTPLDRWDDVKTEYYTIKGERVRSKAEKIIADELTSFGIPYKYEHPLELMDGRDRKTFWPDFIALNCRTRDEYIIEHLGMMDKASYYNYNMTKLDVYERNGYMIGVNLLLFHETSDSPLSISVVRKYIEEYLL